MKRSLITLTIVSMFLALYLIGCGGGDGITNISSIPKPSEGNLEIFVPWPTEDLSASLIQPQVQKIRVETKTSLTGTVVKSIDIPKGQSTGTISGVTTGETYIDFKGLDATDSIITRRIKKITVNPGTNSVTAILGVQIINGQFSPRELPISPNDVLYFANSDDKSYIIRFNVNGQPVRLDIPALSGLTSAEAVSYTFPDSLVSAANLQLFTSETGAAIDTVQFSVELPSGQNYTNVGVWGIQGAYDANYGTVFVAADQDANFYVAVYNPYSRQAIATDNVNYAPYYVNHIEKYDSSGKHLTSSTGGFKIDTTGIVQIAGIAVDPEGRYIYVTDCCGDHFFDLLPGTYVGGTGTIINGNSDMDATTLAQRTNGMGGRVLRFDARNSSVWKDMGHPQPALGYVDAVVTPGAGTGGFNFGENNGLAVSNDGKSLYVVEFYRHVVTNGLADGNYLVHRCDLTNINQPVWNNNAVALGGAFPIDLTAAVIPGSIDFRIVYPRGVAASTSGEIYVLGTVLDAAGMPGQGAYAEPAAVATTNQRIVTYKGIEGTRVTRNYPPASLGTFPVMDFITAIAAYNVPSAGSPIDEAIFAMDWDNFSPEANDLYKYDGGQWKTTPFKTPFTIPAPYDFAAGDEASSGGAVSPYPQLGMGCGVPQIMTVAVCPNQTQEVYVGDAFHRVWKFDKSGNEIDRWRLLYKEYANPAGVATDAQSNVYVVDNLNCRVLKYRGGISGDYITQWGTPPYAAVAWNIDLMNWYDANRDNRELGVPGPNGLPTAGSLTHATTMNAVPGLGGRAYPAQINAAVNTNNLAAGEFYYPWGIAVDETNNAIFVVDWAHQGTDLLPVIPWPPAQATYTYPVDIFNYGGAVSAGGDTGTGTGGNGRVQKFQSPSDTTPGKMTSRVTGTGVEWYSSVQHIFWYPTGISYGNNFVWVCDTFSNSAINPIVPSYGYGIIQKFYADGTQGIVSFAAAEGKQLVHPWGVATDTTNNYVYVSDTENHRVLMYGLVDSQFIKRVSTAGTTAGTGKGQFNLCVGCSLDDGQNLYVVDGFNRRMQKNLAKGGGWIDAWDLNNLLNPLYTAVDKNHMVYTTDAGNHRVKLYLPQN